MLTSRQKPQHLQLQPNCLRLERSGGIDGTNPGVTGEPCIFLNIRMRALGSGKSSSAYMVTSNLQLFFTTTLLLNRQSKSLLAALIDLSGSIRISCCRKRSKSEWDTAGETPAVSRWDATPGRAEEGATPGRWDQTPGGAGGSSRWDATPTPGRDAMEPTPRKNRWDETPTPGRVSSLSLLVTICS